MNAKSVVAYEGARSAFLFLQPGAGELGWLAWLKKIEGSSINGIDDLSALVGICRTCIDSDQLNLSPVIRDRISYSAGYFEATSNVIDDVAREEEGRIVV